MIMKKTLRSVILLVLALSMLLALTACSTSQKSDKVKIGVTLMDFSTEFGIGLKDYMTAKADAMGDVELTVVDAGGDAAKQLQQVETFISQKVDAIIMQPQEQEACSPAIDKAKAAGIPIINCNSLTITEPDAYVGSNDSESAEIAMTYIAEQLGGKGNVLMMHGHPGQTAEVKRTEGAMDILAQNPDMTLLDEQTADWDRAEAMTLMENWIQAYGDQINAVFCQNDEMALGALNALVQAGKKDNVLVVGVDAIDDALQSVKDGKMDATVYQDCKGQAEGAIEAAYKLAKGESVEKEILIPFILVTTENVDEYLK
jgi:inositol transport system substrate-binding protein